MVASSVGTSGNSNADVDDATATISTSTIAGLSEVDLLGGMAGSNLVKGTSLGEFETFATSTEGDTTASSDVNAFGIRDADADGTLTTSGGVTAIAQLVNSIVSTTVNGAATATATSDAVGLSGYSTSLIGDGNLNASALSNTSGRADSVLKMQSQIDEATKMKTNPLLLEPPPDG